MNATGAVLIVDDEELARGTLHRQLTHLGYACTTAAGGREALERLRSGDFDVTLVDLVMPEMDGFAVLSAIEEAHIDTAPVMLTSFGSASHAVEALKHGAFDFIEKPADLDMLAGVIGRAVECRRLRARVRRMSTAAQEWEATFDALPELIAILDQNHRMCRVNKALAIRLGVAPDDLIGQRCCQWIHGSEEPPACCPPRLAAGRWPAARGRSLRT